MTNIRLVNDPFADEIHIYYEDEEITAPENRIWAFFHTDGFLRCLLPFRTKYAVWEGLLTELVREVNDRVLLVAFEGKKEDYELVKEAFFQSKAAVWEDGSKVQWELAHEERFEETNMAEKLKDTVCSLRDLCESRAELEETDILLAQLDRGQLKSACAGLGELILRHMQRWEHSDSEYRQEKLGYLRMLESIQKEIEARMEKCSEAKT